MCNLVSINQISEMEKKEVRAYCRNRHISLYTNSIVPKFFSLQKNRMPWRVEKEQDISRLSEALEAAIEMAKRIRTSGKKPAQDHEVLGPIALLTKIGKGFEWSEYIPPEDVPAVNGSAAFRLDQLRKIRNGKKNPDE
jgi:hypothetical protein